MNGARTLLRRALGPRPVWRSLAIFGLMLLLAYGGMWGIYASAASSPTDRTVALDDDVSIAWRLVREAPDEEAARVLFLHGAPAHAGSWNRFESDALHLLGSCDVVTVDRLGYGNSSIESDLSLRQQAQCLAPLLAERAIVVGHSYGGPVALRAAIEFPDRVAGVVLVAGACDATMEDAQWARRLVESVRWFIPRPWAQANRELLALTDENDAMTPLLEGVTCPVAIVHGTWDPVCPHDGTITYLQSTLVNADVIVDSLPRAGHNLHLSHPERIAHAIVDLLPGGDS